MGAVSKVETRQVLRILFDWLGLGLQIHYIHSIITVLLMKSSQHVNDNITNLEYVFLMFHNLILYVISITCK
jgi:hypothetical protein